MLRKIIGISIVLFSLIMISAPRGFSQVITCSAAPPASTATIQHCIDITPVGGQLELQPGSYNVDSQLLINKPMLLTTHGRANTGPACFDNFANVDWTCAVLVATANFSTQGPVLKLQGPNITLDHIVVHGNRDQRINATLAAACGTNNKVGMNIWCDSSSPSTACDNVTFRNGVSTSAVCGSGFALYGNNPNVNNSMFSYNGNGAAGPGSDGLTLTPCKDGQSDSTCPASGLIYNNYFFSNTDIDLIAFAGPGLRIQNNHFHHYTTPATHGFATIMLDNFNRNGGPTGSNTPDSALGNFIGADVSGNVVNCNGYCDFGIVLGGHPWYILPTGSQPCHATPPPVFPYVCKDTEPLINIYGGSVHDNQISGAEQGIVADGAGRAHWMNATCNDTALNCAVRIWNNTIQGTFGPNVIMSCGQPFTTSPLNVRSGNLGETTVVCWGPNCVSSEVPPSGTTFNPWHGCP